MVASGEAELDVRTAAAEAAVARCMRMVQNVHQKASAQHAAASGSLAAMESQHRMVQAHMLKRLQTMIKLRRVRHVLSKKKAFACARLLLNTWHRMAYVIERSPSA